MSAGQATGVHQQPWGSALYLGEDSSMIGTTVGHYRILAKLGEGGMGVVYRAEDTRLDRIVALKFLPSELTRDVESKRRFIHEAKAASALQHNNICTVHDIDETDDEKLFIVMDYYDGESLKEKVARGPLKPDEAVGIAIQIAHGLQKAHEKGIVHRDIKSGNIIVTSDGIAKILDFGLAKLAGQVKLTRTGSTVGTAAYMSPEQAKGRDVDHRTDIWSLGVVLYEMLTGRLPFPGDYDQAIIYRTLNEAPEPLRQLVPDISSAVDRIVNRALQKDRESRYPSAAEMLKDLENYRQSTLAKESWPSGMRDIFLRLRKRHIVIPALLTLLTSILLSVWFFDHQSRIRWAREVALPEIERGLQQNDVWRNLVPVYRLATEAEAVIPDDQKLDGLMSKCSLKLNIRTEPPGAKIYMKEYNAPEGAWTYLGVTPIENIRLPIGVFRWKFEKEGYETVLAAASTWNGDITKPDIVIPCDLERLLDKKESIPQGMVRVQATETPVGKLNDFFIDKYEVTNAQYKKFIDDGGYRNRRFWKQRFVEEGRELTWDEAIRRFVDQSGQPGPATWQAGDYPEGQADHPVAGVSWYEAAAYAEYLKKSLPTGYHWGMARGEYTPMIQLPQLGGFALFAPFSNFLGNGTVPVGSLSGVTAYGAFDMAGNVREWCSNETEKGRLIRGGAWGENTYMNEYWSQAPAMNRSAKNGFRCALYHEPDKIPRLAFKGVDSPGLLIFGRPEEITKEKPVDDAIFQIYKQQFSYDNTDLNARVEWRKESSAWFLEKISFNAAYGGERVSAYLFLPKTALPPFQTVIYWGGDVPVFQRSSRDIENYYEIPMFVSFLVKNGRAVFYPLYKGFFERGSEALISVIETDYSTHQWADVFVQQVKDLRRSVDYLETRSDVDSKRLGYYSMCYGSILAPTVLAVEERLKVSVLLAGGFGYQGGPPRAEVSQINYVTRVTSPVLMLNGRYDSFLPVELAQRPMFDLLGTSSEDKKWKLYETDHIPPVNETIKETIAWFNRYLGPVSHEHDSTRCQSAGAGDLSRADRGRSASSVVF